MRASDPRLQPDEQWQAWVRLLVVIAISVGAWALLGLAAWGLWRFLT